MASTWQKTPGILQLEKVEIQGQTMATGLFPLPVTLVITSYLSVVALGPSFLKQQRQLGLQALLVTHSLAVVALSSSGHSVLASYRHLCQPVDYSRSKLGMRVFSILRKKQEQVTFLHVYHHGSMLFSWWSGLKYMPGGQAFFIGMLNSFVHIFMDGYYALASLGLRMCRHVWWKRYPTVLQLCQFVAIAARSSYNLITECPFPDGFNTAAFLYILALFLHCYCRTCLRGKQEKLT